MARGLKARQIARGATVAFTGAVKLAGLVIAINEAFFVDAREPFAFAVAAFMMAGAQGLEELLTRRP